MLSIGMRGMLCLNPYSTGRYSLSVKTVSVNRQEN